jgi:carbon monoxide dehydrogenase subunit G
MAIELDNSFTVPVPPEQAWNVLLDVERIAPCMPGAKVLSVADDSIEGQVKVKLGPLSLTYKGTAKFVEKDEASHTIVLDASGKEARNAGTASALVNAVLKPGEEPGTTIATIHTSLNVTGKPAQFGRSLLPEISGKLIAQFADNLAELISAGSPGTNDAAEAAVSATEATASATGAAASAIETAASAIETAGRTAEAAATALDAEAATDEAATGAAATDEAGDDREVDEAAGDGVTATAEAAATPAGSQPATPAAPPAVKQEESLNAFKYVVVPVLKRVVPVAVVGAGIALLARKLLRRNKSS